MVTLQDPPQGNKMDEFRMITMEEQKDILELLVKKNTRLEADLRDLWAEIQRLTQERSQYLPEGPELFEKSVQWNGGFPETDVWKARNLPRNFESRMP